jgi:lysyl-tRNA synthetase class 2
VGGAERVFELKPQLPQRRGRRHPQPGIHLAGGVRGVLGLRRHAGACTGDDPARVAVRPGSTTVVRDGTAYDLAGTWRAIIVNEAISAALGEEVTADTGVQDLRKHCDRLGIPYAPGCVEICGGTAAPAAGSVTRWPGGHTSRPPY